MTRFLHTGDWQLGMTRHFLEGEAQARFSQDRFDAVRTLGRVAGEAGCEFVVVCGDVFESNQVDRRTVVRGLEAMATVPVPVWLLPGNHDPLDAGTVYRTPSFREHVPPNVHVLDAPGVHAVADGVELVAAPWFSKRPLEDLVAASCAGLAPRPGIVRVAVAHGALSRLSPDREDPAVIAFERAQELLADGRLHFLALGDRHSLTRFDDEPRIAYAGSPEPTDFDEEAPGQALVVELDAAGALRTEARSIGRWRFVRAARELSADADLEDLAQWLEERPDKERTVLELRLEGTLRVAQRVRLDAVLEHARDLFAALELSARHSDLVVVADDDDFRDLELAGFARDAVATLRARAAGGGEEAEAAREALGLLVRLAGRSG